MGLHIGLTTDDLRRIGYPELSWLIYRWGELNAPEETESNDGVRDATDKDVQALMLM